MSDFRERVIDILVEYGSFFEFDQKKLKEKSFLKELDQATDQLTQLHQEAIEELRGNEGVAKALGSFAQKSARQTALHWYMGLDDSGAVAMFPEEIGLPLEQAVDTTIDTIKRSTAKELIGEDEHTSVEMGVGRVNAKKARNQLRAEQRRKAGLGEV